MPLWRRCCSHAGSFQRASAFRTALCNAAAEYVVHGEYLANDPSVDSGQATGLPPANGQTYVLPGGAFFDIRDGRIAAIGAPPPPMPSTRCRSVR